MTDEQNILRAEGADALSSFDFEKFKVILRRSWILALLFIIITVLLAYLYIRYTKPVYESSSIVQLNIESDASMLNISSPVVKQDWALSSEIELIRSRLFFDKVASALNIDVSYYKYGRVLDDERYGNNPFVVSYLVKAANYYDQNLDIELKEDGFMLPWLGGGKLYLYDQEIITSQINLQISKTEYFSSSAFGTYYFIINSRNRTIDRLKRSVVVAPESFNANTLRISIEDYNPKKAQDLIRTIDSVYIDYTKDAKNRTMQQKVAFLEERVKDTEVKIADFEKFFQKSIIEYRTTDLSENLNNTLSQLVPLDSALSAMRQEKVALRILEAELLKEQPVLINDFFLNKFPSQVQSLVQEYLEKSDQRVVKLRSYNENSYAIERLDAELKSSRERLMKNMEAYQEIVDSEISQIRYKMTQLEKALYELPSLQNEYSKMSRSYARQEEFMNSLLTAKMEIEISLAGTVTNIAVLSPASYPRSPIKPQKPMVYGIGVVAGIFLSILFIMIRYLLNNKISSITELERLIDAPILGTLPMYRQEKLARTRMVMDENSKSSLSEALRTIRTNMEFMNPDNDTRILSITSTISGEGKTFLGVNLGAIIAMSDQRVCVVDVDMRKPKIHLAFGDQNNVTGVSTVLAGKNVVDECLKETSISNLSYLPAGPTPPNPSELILGKSFDDLLQDLSSKFDLVIVDTPPVGLVTDGILVMKKTDLQLYVVRADYSQRNFIKTIHYLKTTNRFDRLTVVFNGLSRSSGYGYGYGQGQGYYEEPEGKGVISTIKSL